MLYIENVFCPLTTKAPYSIILHRQRDECHIAIQNLEQAKKPLLKEKDELFKMNLKLEDSMKEARGEVNRIYSESCDTSDLQREVNYYLLGTH